MYQMKLINRLSRIAMDFPCVENEMLDLISQFSNQIGTNDQPSAHMLDKVRNLYENESKVKAVILWKKTFGTSLMEAKRAVEQRAQTLGWSLVKLY